MAYRYSTGPPSISYSFVSLSKTLKFFTLLTSQEVLATSLSLDGIFPSVFR